MAISPLTISLPVFLPIDMLAFHIYAASEGNKMPEPKGYLKYLKNDNLLQWVDLYEVEKVREHDDEEKRWDDLLKKDPAKMIRPEKERLVIILRAKDFSVSQIAKRVQLSRPTVIGIVRDHATAIAKLSSLELQELLAAYNLTTKRKLQVFGGVLGRLLDELQRRDLADLTTDRLLEVILKFSKAIGDTVAEKVAKARESQEGEETEFSKAAVS